MKIFFDTEFTGLHQKTSLISIGLISDNGSTFYAEFNDYDKSQVDDWISNNVIKNLDYNDSLELFLEKGHNIFMKDNTKVIALELEKWLKQFDNIKMWSDCLAYDWVLFNQIFGHAFKIPKNVFYIPFDISTLFEIKSIDPDINREVFCNQNSNKTQKHNSLWDAKVIKMCYDKLLIDN